MAQTVKIAGATYNNVPYVNIPKLSGGNATFLEETELQAFYTGSSEPAASLGNNGDLYLKV